MKSRMSNNNSNTLQTYTRTDFYHIKRLRHLFCAVVLIIIDQLTKYFARTSFSDGSDYLFIPKIIRFVLHKNTGAMWGIFSDTKNSVIYLTLATVIILSLILFVYFHIPDTKKYTPLLWIIVFVFSGAIGNLIDRIFLQYVTDFICTEFINFPVFNVADCYITVSVFVLCYLILFHYTDSDLDFLSFKKHKSTK